MYSQKIAEVTVRLSLQKENLRWRVKAVRSRNG
jgi:hypothetical protein